MPAVPRTPESNLPRKSDQELHELAVGILQNAIFTDRHIDPKDAHLSSMIFMPLGFLDRSQLLALKRKQRPGMVYAEMRHAGPRAINGYPMFFECAILHPGDAEVVWKKYKTLAGAVGHDAHDVEGESPD
jgi:hypothetical protein